MPPESMRRRSAALALAVFVLAVPLVLPDRPGAFVPRWPLELPILLLLLSVAPRGLLGPLRFAVVTLLSFLLMLTLLDLATRAALNRPFNLVLDLPLVVASWRLAAGSLGWPLALAVAAAALLLLGLVVGALRWATRQIPAAPRRWRLAAVPVALVLAAVGTADASRRVGEHLLDGWQAVGDSARLRAEAAVDPWAQVAADEVLPALRGRDVFVIFVESYGRSAFDNPRYAGTTTTALGEAEARLARAGLATRSGWLGSPVVGGQSWLAHATLLSGLRIDGEGRYRALVSSPRRTLLHLAQAAGWTTAAVMPAITLPWPEAAYFGYDRVLAAKDLGYRGLPFNWVTMPDQFTLAAFERALLDPVPRKNVFAEVALISSHAPWTPIPPLVPWDALGDGRVFDAFATAGDPPDVVWRDPDRVREQFRQALDYTLRVVMAFAERRAGSGPLLVVLGDHQPAPFVSGDPEGRDVPVHVIGPPEIVAELDDLGWTAGLVPDPEASSSPMEGFRDQLLAAFAGPPPALRAAAGQALPTQPRR